MEMDSADLQTHLQQSGHTTQGVHKPRRMFNMTEDDMQSTVSKQIWMQRE